MKAIKSILSLANIFYASMGIVILLVISLVCPLFGIIAVGGLLYYIYKCCKKRG